MADHAIDLFIFRENFEAIVGVLGSDEGLEKEFVSAVSEVSVQCFFFYLSEPILCLETCM